jgi:hypothetical protein
LHLRLHCLFKVLEVQLHLAGLHDHAIVASLQLGMLQLCPFSACSFSEIGASVNMWDVL